MEKKQKVLFFLALVMVGFLAYEIYRLMAADMSTAPCLVAPETQCQFSNSSDEQWKGAVMGVAQTAAKGQDVLSGSRSGGARGEENSSLAGSAERSANEEQQQLSPEQKKYLQLLQDYSLAKMEHRLLEEQAAIAAARQRIAQLKAQTRKVEQSSPSLPQSQSGKETRTASSSVSTADNRPEGEVVVSCARQALVSSSNHLAGHLAAEIERDGAVCQMNDNTERLPIARCSAHWPQQQPLSVPSELSDQESEQQILELPASAYTLQLIGSYEEGVINHFISAHHLEGKVMFFYVNHQGKPWRMLIYGHYPSYAAARLALAHLPAEMQGEGPWVRSLASIQQAIKKRQNSQ